jgi:hypothetical protein
MLTEVRKEAFLKRFNRGDKASNASSDVIDDEDEVEGDGSMTIVEIWKSWYPQEWVDWVMYGAPSENPTDHWVNQPISAGPTDVETYFTDEKGTKSSRRPPGRTNQREKVSMESVQSKQSSDSNSLRAQHLKQVAEEMEASNSARDLYVIENLREMQKRRKRR